MSALVAKYKEPYGKVGKVRVHEYLGIVMTARYIASIRWKPTPDRFWVNNSAAKKEIKKNQQTILDLLYSYPEEAIVKAFLRKDMKHAYSVKFPGLLEAIREEAAILKRIKESEI